MPNMTNFLTIKLLMLFLDSGQEHAGMTEVFFNH